MHVRVQLLRPVTEEVVEPDDEILLVVGDVAALDVWPEIVEPPQPAALAATSQTYVDQSHAYI